MLQAMFCDDPRTDESMRRTPFVAMALALTMASVSSAQPAGLFALPIACDVGKTCFLQNYFDVDPGPGEKDYTGGAMTYDGHNGVDIRLPTLAAMKAGVAVKAAAAGQVKAVREGMMDVSTAVGGPVPADRMCGNGVLITHSKTFETQYCHMASGSIAVKPGDQVAAGQALGRVGLSGNTEFPHLHFTVYRDGVRIDPFTPGLWNPAAKSALVHRAPVLINMGFASGPVTGEDIDGGAIPGPRIDTNLVVYARAIGLNAGDNQKLTLLAPDGRTITQNAIPALDRAKAQYFAFTGSRNGGRPWTPGMYRGRYEIHRGGALLLKEERTITL